jgi:hypothetical protein
LGAQVGTGLYGGQIDQLTGQIAGVKGGRQGQQSHRWRHLPHHRERTRWPHPDEVAEKIDAVAPSTLAGQTGRQLLVT